jgi:hypothetical protein
VRDHNRPNNQLKSSNEEMGAVWMNVINKLFKEPTAV